MPSDNPHELVQSLRAEVDHLSRRLAGVVEGLDLLSASLPQPAPRPPQPAAVRTPPQPSPYPAPQYEPAGHPPPRQRPTMPPGAAPVPVVEAGGGDGSLDVAERMLRDAVGRMVRPPGLRRPANVAEIFAVVGSAVTLIGVALVLLLPQDGFLGPLARTGIGLALAAAAVTAAFLQHRADPRNLGGQALLATGLASTFLCVVALTVIFRTPAGGPYLSALSGLGLAGVVTLTGMGIAREWSSQWLAVLAVLGSLVLAPFLGAETLVGLTFMVVVTGVTGLMQRGLGWAGLVVARSLPTGLAFFAVAADGDYSGPFGAANEVGAVLLAAVLALVGLGLAAWHQSGPRGEEVAGAASVVVLSAPLAAAAWGADQVTGVVALVGGALAFSIAGFVAPGVRPALRATAIPLGALFWLMAVLVAFDGRQVGVVLFGMAAAYLALAGRTRDRLVLLVGSVVASLALLRWLPTVAGFFDWRPAGGDLPWLGLPDAAAAAVGVAAALLGARAFRDLLTGPDEDVDQDAAVRRREVIRHLTWAAALALGSVGVVVAGTVAGRALGQPFEAFQISHGAVTVAWMALCVALLSRGLRRSETAPGSVSLAIALAVAAVLKLFLFDLAALPGLARALAFIVVGVLLLVVGTWYRSQLDRTRRPSAEPDREEG